MVKSVDKLIQLIEEATVAGMEGRVMGLEDLYKLYEASDRIEREMDQIIFYSKDKYTVLRAYLEEESSRVERDIDCLETGLGIRSSRD